MILVGRKSRKSCLNVELETDVVFRIPILMGESTQKYKENYAWQRLTSLFVIELSLQFLNGIGAKMSGVLGVVNDNYSSHATTIIIPVIVCS